MFRPSRRRASRLDKVRILSCWEVAETEDPVASTISSTLRSHSESRQRILRRFGFERRESRPDTRSQRSSSANSTRAAPPCFTILPYFRYYASVLSRLLSWLA